MTRTIFRRECSYFLFEIGKGGGGGAGEVDGGNGGGGGVQRVTKQEK